jgi:hypothetical protein
MMVASTNVTNLRVKHFLRFQILAILELLKSPISLHLHYIHHIVGVNCQEHYNLNDSIISRC